MKYKFLSFATMIFVAFFMACTNEKVEMPTQSIISEDIVINSEIDATLDDLSLIAEDQYAVQISTVAKVSAPVKSVLPACATITSTLTNDTFTRTIDFGTEGCLLANGNSVKGKIIVSFSKNTTTALKSISYTLVNFYHNTKLIEGNKTLTFELKSTDLSASLHPVSTHSIDIKITNSDGKVYTRTGTRVREMVEGYFTTTTWDDNIFLVWGTDITTFPNGSIYTTKITTPLKIMISCNNPFPVSGVVSIQKNNSSATLDYGTGTCDKLATLTINGVSKEITLRK